MIKKRQSQIKRGVLQKVLSKERLDLRLSGENKQILEKAAIISGLGSTNAFVVTAAVTNAYYVIAEHDGILTTEKARKSFFSALENPEPPNQALRLAFQKRSGALTARYEEHGV